MKNMLELEDFISELEDRGIDLSVGSLTGNLLPKKFKYESIEVILSNSGNIIVYYYIFKHKIDKITVKYIPLDITYEIGDNSKEFKQLINLL